jgi:tRNA A-37 threonylcarbamoyl transferase component Bud32
VIKADEHTSVLAGDAAGYEVVVKTLALDRVKDRIRAAFRLSRHWRQARGAVLAGAAGVEAAPVLAIVRGVNLAGHRVEAMIMDRVEGPTLLRAASERTLSVSEARALIDEVGRDVGRLARSGLMNRDHKPSNVIVRREPDAGLQPVLIDTADIRRAKPLAALTGMLSKLLIESIGTDVRIDAAHQVRAARAALRESGLNMRLSTLLAAVRQAVDLHGDARPKDDPLAFDA